MFFTQIMIDEQIVIGDDLIMVFIRHCMLMRANNSSILGFWPSF
jgi:hypothetical protein